MCEKGTTCMVVSDGMSYNTRANLTCGGNQLDSPDGTRYRPSQCNRRILISQPAQGIYCCILAIFFVVIAVGQ